MPVYSLARRLHAWAGLAFSLVILLIAVTGTLLVWEDDYLRLSIDEAHEIFEPDSESLSRITADTLKLFGPEQVLLIKFADERLAINKIFLSGRRSAYTDTSGNIIDLWQGSERFEDWLYRLHHQFLIGSTGNLILGFLGLAMLPFMLTGIMAFMSMRNSYAQGVRISSARPLFLQTHRNLGVTLVLPLLLVFITGTILCFPKQAQKFLVHPGQKTDAYQARFVERLDSLSGQNYMSWQAILERAQRLYPAGKIRSLQPGSSGSVVVAIQQDGDWHQNGTTRIYFDMETGVMKMNKNARRSPFLERLYRLSYPLHTAKTGSRIYQVWVTLLGLGLSALSLLGLVSFYTKVSYRKESSLPAETTGSDS